MSWFLTLNSIHMTIVDFELVVASREYGEYVFVICNYNICVFYNKLGNCIVISNRNISVITMKVVLLFFFYKMPTKAQTRPNFLHSKCNPPYLPAPPPSPHPPFKQKFIIPQNRDIWESWFPSLWRGVRLIEGGSDLLIYYIYVMRCAIWYHLYNLKNVKNIHGEVSLLRKD